MATRFTEVAFDQLRLEMLSRESALTAIEIAARPATDLWVRPGVDRERYIDFLEADLLANLCEPFAVSAAVRVHGLSFDKGQDSVKAFCVAHRSGTWLLYEPASHRFIGATGKAEDSLSVHPSYASPLASWAGALRLPGK